jgi:hypothetical protein
MRCVGACEMGPESLHPARTRDARMLNTDVIRRDISTPSGRNALKGENRARAARANRERKLRNDYSP